MPLRPIRRSRNSRNRAGSVYQILYSPDISVAGHSNIFLGADEMEWSNLVGSGVHADFETAVYTGGCGCPADFDGDGFVTGDDFDGFAGAFQSGSTAADFNGDGFVTGDDFDAFVLAFEAGC